MILLYHIIHFYPILQAVLTTLLALSSAQYIQDTPEVAAAKRQFAAAFNAAAARAQQPAAYAQQPAYPQQPSYPQQPAAYPQQPAAYAQQPSNNYDDSISPAAVPYVHESIPAEPYVHVDIPAEPYEHVEIAAEPYVHIGAPRQQQQQPQTYAAQPQQQPAAYNYDPYAAPQVYNNIPAQQQYGQSGCYNWKGEGVECRTDFS